MNEKRAQAILDGQTASARKVFACVPADEPMAASKIHGRASAECNHDLHTTRGCLSALHSAGLIRQVSKDRYQRVADLPGATLHTLATEAATPKLGDLMRPALIGTNPAKPIPQSERPAPKRESAMAHLMVDMAANTKVSQGPFPANPEQQEVVELDVSLPEGVFDLQGDPKGQADPLAQMADLAVELLEATQGYTDRVKAITARLENIALDIEAERQENSRAAKQLAKFKALLNDASE